MEHHTFEMFRNIVYRESGIVLTPDKLSLLSSRIQKRIRALDLRNDTEYLKIVELDATREELIHLIDAVSTNVTFFYREPQHFAHFRQILSGWKDEKRKEVRIWCSAASSGEEPYTLAFEAAESLDLSRQSLKILATDICTPVLEKAQRGVYSEQSVEKIPEQLRDKYLIPHEENGERCWQISPDISQFLLFKKLNLVQHPYPLKGPLDIIFCRNVMIYFDVKTREGIVKEFQRLLRPGGYLFISHSESLMGIEHTLRKAGPSVFQKEDLKA
jgi:chemotaxis protein methyltransferase CheR